MRRTGKMSIGISGLVGYHNAEGICVVLVHSCLLGSLIALRRRRIVYDDQNEFRI